ncbi:NINE protein [Agromyces laixinhei]|uniref:NINE protein n=1 Tax=Agromyces laixinhei TaxID=2585717 RepID=UPI0012ED09BC|nr:NINE protein [Agromyces laixinhei]
MSLEAGWYDDEADAALLRYWDGTAWSPHTAPRPADAAPNPLPAAAGASAAPSAPLTPPAPPAAPAALAAQTPPAFDDIDESTSVRPPRSQAAPAAQAPAAFPPPPAAPAASPPPPAAPPAAPGELPSYTLPAPPGYTLQEQTTAPLPPEYGATSGPQFSYDPYRTAGRTFIATWLFAMLLGYWGADRFYLGKFGTAIAKLLTLGGLGVWVLVDLLLVLTGSQRDRDGRPLEGYDEHKRTAWIVTGALVGLGMLIGIVSSVVSLLVR